MKSINNFQNKMNKNNYLEMNLVYQICKQVLMIQILLNLLLNKIMINLQKIFNNKKHNKFKVTMMNQNKKQNKKMKLKNKVHKKNQKKK